MQSAAPPDAQAVIDFWFADENRPRWYVADAVFDSEIRRRFGALVEAAASDRLDDWAHRPLSWLALLILLDQFSRNLHRNDARAWAQDVKAQRICLSGIANQDDRQLTPQQRVFAYMPLEHAENMVLQHRAVALFEALRDEAPAEQRADFDEFVAYARKHRDVIGRFGRFPHRNALLGRVNTVEEAAYLAQPGSGF